MARPDPDGLRAFEDVMDADDLRALFGCFQCQRKRSAQALICGCLIGQGANKALSAGSQQQRHAQAMEQRQTVHNLQIMGDVAFAKTNARVGDDPALIHASGHHSGGCQANSNT